MRQKYTPIAAASTTAHTPATTGTGGSRPNPKATAKIATKETPRAAAPAAATGEIRGRRTKIRPPRWTIGTPPAGARLIRRHAAPPSNDHKPSITTLNGVRKSATIRSWPSTLGRRWRSRDRSPDR